MRSKERLRRIERGIAAVELAAREAGLATVRDLETLEKILVAEIKAGVAVHVACPERSKGLAALAAATVQRARELQAATGETGATFAARVERLLATAGRMEVFTDSLRDQARPAMQELLRDVRARVLGPPHS